MKCLNCNKKIGWVNRGTYEEYIEYINSKDMKNGGVCSFKCEKKYMEDKENQNKLEKFEKKILKKLPKIYLILFCMWKRRKK